MIVSFSICTTWTSIPLPTAIQGQTLLPYLAPGEPAESVEVFAAGVIYGQEQRAVYADRWKLLYNLHTYKTMLYDIVQDPLEQKDLSADHPQRVRRMNDLLKAQAEVDLEFAAGAETKIESIPDEERERLKALGYTN